MADNDKVSAAAANNGEVSAADEDTVYRRFKQVKDYTGPNTKRLIYRSSAPNYRELDEGGSDKTQVFDEKAYKFLKDNKVKMVISFNQWPYDKTTKAYKDMEKDGIQYHHFSVVDFDSPTAEQMKQAIAKMDTVMMGTVLVHCGYGWGRTGTLITAMQLKNTGGEAPDEIWWKKGPNDEGGNHVERDGQIETLRKWREDCRNGRI